MYMVRAGIIINFYRLFACCNSHKTHQWHMIAFFVFCGFVLFAWQQKLFAGCVMTIYRISSSSATFSI